jgi:hypothetical protein
MSDKPWTKEVPSKGKSMSSSQVKSAKARARAAGRPYPNLVDNMAAMKEDSVDEACWDGYKKVGMKKKGNRMVPNCVPEAVSPAQQAAIAISMKKAGKKPKDMKEAAEPHSKNKMKPSSRFEGSKELVDTYKKDTPGQSAHRIVKKVIEEVLYECGGNCTCGKKKDIDENEYQNPNGGLSQKGRDHYNRTTGSHLQAPVTKEPSKLKKGSRAHSRRKSFCARMGGMKKRLTSAKTARDPDSRINKALRKWNC